MIDSGSRYYISVSYNLNRFVWGSQDSVARKIAKDHEGGGGTGFGRRDLSFYYPTQRRAENAVARFRKSARFRIDQNVTDLFEESI